MFRDQVQGFMKNLLESLKSDDMKGCVTDLGYWQQATLDAVKNDQGLQDYVAAVSKPLVECKQEEEAAPVMEEAAPVEEETAAPAEEETAAPAEELPVDVNADVPVVEEEEVVSAPVEEESESVAVEEEASTAEVEEEPVAPTKVAPTKVAPAPAISGWGRRMQAPTPKETLDDVLDAWVDYVEETLVKGKECGDKWMEYGLAVGELYEQGWENNTGLYTLQTQHMNLLNDAWRACL